VELSIQQYTLFLTRLVGGGKGVGKKRGLTNNRKKCSERQNGTGRRRGEKKRIQSQKGGALLGGTNQIQRKKSDTLPKQPKKKVEGIVNHE